MLITISMLTGSLIVLMPAAEGSQSARESAGNGDNLAPDSADTGRGHSPAWRWSEMVDSTGNDNVILWMDNPQSTRGVLDLLEGRHPERAPAGLDVAFLHESSSIKCKFSVGFTGISVKIAPEALEQLLASEPNLRAYPDLTVNATSLTTDSLIGADVMWNRTDGYGDSIDGTGITVAVIDTGIYYLHPDLGGGFGPGHRVSGGYDFFNNDSDPIDDNGHGTHVAGIIAADGGSKGVAPGATLLAYKALGSDGSGSMSSVIQSIEAAMDPNGDGSTSDHADVISMSLGGSGESTDPLCQAVNRAVAAGVVVVIAAGNSGPSSGTIMSPGLASGAITVGAVDNKGVLASFSSRGPTPDLKLKPEISAPGVSVVSTVPYSGTTYCSSTGYMPMSGTSMATPHISGAAALLLQAHSSWSPVQVKSALISGAKPLAYSFWSAGAGEAWIPSSADVPLVTSAPLFSLAVYNGSPYSIPVTNLRQSPTYSVASSDWYSLSADASSVHHAWTNYSKASCSSISIASGSNASLSVSLSVPNAASQGYYDGYLTLTSGSSSCRIPFGFIVLSTVKVHVVDTDGREVRDPWGAVYLYSYPSADTIVQKKGSGASAPSCPATFLVPSGQYAINAAGRQVIYASKSPYILSSVISVGSMQSIDVNLSMNSAHVATMNLQTPEGNPIYVQDFRLYVRYAGVKNVSFDFTASDLDMTGSRLFSLPHSIKVYVGDTDASIGFSITGYAYSQAMWNFMSLNWDHWYEFTGSLSTSFIIPATADLEYLLSWEFQEVTSSFPSALSYDLSSCSIYTTKYDIPGTIASAWCVLGTHKAMGGESAYWIRRDTATSLNPFFTGMNRTVIVGGVFSEKYYPGDLSGGYLEREFYVADYSHMLPSSSSSVAYLPDRLFVTPSVQTNAIQRIGIGPLYPSLHTANTNSSLVLFHPILRDQWGDKIGGKSIPVLSLYKNGALTGTYQLPEYLSRLDAERIFSLSGNGRYSAQISYSVFPDIFRNVSIGLSFSVPSSDPNPPVITGLSVPQRFMPGDQLPISLSAGDARSAVTVEMSSRSGEGAPWVALNVKNGGSGSFTSVLSTSNGDSIIDLKVVVRDAAGNYLNYTAYRVAERETPVQFDIRPSVTKLDYVNSNKTVVLTGYLRTASGDPLNETARVPLDLWIGGKKVGMILDDYVSGTTVVHNGTIRFAWVFNPRDIFTSAGETVTVTVAFDLGTYTPVTKTFTLTSSGPPNLPPTITLSSPTNGSVVTAGTMIDLSITDDGPTISAGYSVDNSQFKSIAAPWDISTAGWSDATHAVKVYARDNNGANTTLQFQIAVDLYSPTLSITSPLNGSVIPTGSSMVVSVFDSHLSVVSYSIDGASSIILSAPYTVSLSSLSLGRHTVIVTAVDAVGHTSSARTTFEIVSATVVVSLVSPSSGSIIRSGVPIVLSVLGSGSLTCTWSELSVSHTLQSPYSISTAGWSERAHVITVLASNDVGGSSQLTFNLTVDDTPPVITLVSPANGSFVTQDQSATVSVSDLHYKKLSWTVAGLSASSTSTSVAIPFGQVSSDCYFTVAVTATDIVNNNVTSSFTFAMDCLPPTVSFDAVASNHAVRSGATLNLTASDAFLADVQLSIDGGASRSVTVPYAISTKSFTLGWHSLTAVAEDSIGHTSDASLSIYVDGITPSVSMISGTVFQADSPFNVEASLTDDIGVSSAVLFYSLPEGGFESLAMNGSGTLFTAALPADRLWSGMTVYVVVSDTVGNTAEGARETLQSSSSGSPVDGDKSGLSMLGLPGLSWLSPLSVGLILAAAVLLSMFMVIRSNRKEDENPVSDRHPVTPAPSLIEEGKKTSLGMVSGVAGPSPAPTPARSMPSRPTSVSYAEFVKKDTFSVLDDLPSLPRGNEDASDEECDLLMEQLEELRREMTALQSKRSLFREEEASPQLGDDEDDDEGKPRIARGLQIKPHLK